MSPSSLPPWKLCEEQCVVGLTGSDGWPPWLEIHWPCGALADARAHGGEVLRPKAAEVAFV